MGARDTASNGGIDAKVEAPADEDAVSSAEELAVILLSSKGVANSVVGASVIEAALQTEARGPKQEIKELSNAEPLALGTTPCPRPGTALAMSLRIAVMPNR